MKHVACAFAALVATLLAATASGQTATPDKPPANQVAMSASVAWSITDSVFVNISPTPLVPYPVLGYHRRND